MKIQSVTLARLGPWRDLKLELAPDLHVLYGPNEAGKSTLLRFIRGGLYGRSPARTPESASGLEPGSGVLELVTSAGLVRVEQRWPDQPSAATIASTDARQVDDCSERSPLPLDVLGSVDESTYARVFAIGLREIQELATLSGDEASRKLYELASGMENIDLASVLADLRDARNRVWFPDSGPHLWGTLRGERRRLEQKLRAARRATIEARIQHARCQEIEAELERCEQERRDVEARLAGLAAEEVVREQYHRKASIERQLAHLGHLPAFPADGIERLDAICQQLARGRWARKRWKRRAAYARERWRRALREKCLAISSQSIESIRTLALDLEERQAAIARIHEETAHPRPESGDRPDPTDAAASFSTGQSGVPRGHLGRLRRAARSLLMARKELRRAQKAASEARQRRAAAPSPHGTGETSRARHELAAELRRCGERVSGLRKLIQIDDRRDELEQHRAQLEERLARLRDAELQPVGSLLGLGVIFVGAVGATLFGVAKLLLPSIFGAALAWWLSLGGLATASLALAWKWYGDRRLDADLESVEQRWALVGNQLAQLERERERLAGDLAVGDTPTADLLKEAEDDLAALEQQLADNDPDPTNHGGSGAQPAPLEQAEAALKQARRAWKHALRQAGLPESFTPGEVRRRARAVDRPAAEVKAPPHWPDAASRREHEIRELEERLDRAMARAGLEPVRGSASKALLVLDEFCRCQEAARHTVRQWRRRMVAARRHGARAARRLMRLRSFREALLGRVHALDEDEFRRLARLCRQADELRAERDRLDDEILAAERAGMVDRPAPVPNADGSRAETRRGLQAQIDRLGKRIVELTAEREGILAARASASGASAAARWRLRHDLAAARLGAARDRWQAQALVEIAIRHATQAFEEKRQPAIVRHASPYFRRITNGQYERVVARIGSHALWVEDRQGRRFPLDALSEGTREQLYLCLRLALVASFADRGTRLPVVLDDVFVNYDDDRAEAAAELLVEFVKATGVQTIVLTCHRHIFGIFARLGVQSRELPISREPAHGTPVAAAGRGRLPRRSSVSRGEARDVNRGSPGKKREKPHMEERSGMNSEPRGDAPASLPSPVPPSDLPPPDQHKSAPQAAEEPLPAALWETADERTAWGVPHLGGTFHEDAAGESSLQDGLGGIPLLSVWEPSSGWEETRGEQSVASSLEASESGQLVAARRGEGD